MALYALLLCLYFPLLFLKDAYGSIAGYYSVLTDRLDLRFLSAVYMAPPYLYLALRMKSRWRWALCAAVGAVAEKYNSALLIERTPNEFSVASAHTI